VRRNLDSGSSGPHIRSKVAAHAESQTDSMHQDAQNRQGIQVSPCVSQSDCLVAGQVVLRAKREVV